VVTGEKNRLGDSCMFDYDDEGRSIGTKEFSNKMVTTEYDDAKNTATTKYRDGSDRVIVKDATGNKHINYLEAVSLNLSNVNHFEYHQDGVSGFKTRKPKFLHS